MKQRFKTVFSFAKKVSLVILVYFVVFALYSKFTNPNPTGAPIQNPVLETRKEIYQAINNPELKKTKEGKDAIAIYRFSLCSTVGEACTNNPSDGDKYYKDSLMSKVGGLMSTPFENPPASGLYWARDSMQHIGLLPSAYAAEGIGFSKLSPLLAMWKAFRNVAYLLVVLAILAVGFMIMFRVKINPQTVVSLENALPRIFISLILITFSFAIAGFMIDLMYTIILLGISVLAKGDPSLNLGKLQNDFMSPDMSDLFDSMFPSRTGMLTSAPLIGGFVQLSDLGSAIAYVLPSWINDIFKIFGMMIFTHFGLDLIFNVNGLGVATHLGEILNKWDILGTGVGDTPGHVIVTYLKLILTAMLVFFSLRWGIGWILGLIIFLTIVLLVFRIFVLLFAGYVKILLYVIFSPLYLLANMIPGRNAFSQWFRGFERIPCYDYDAGYCPPARKYLPCK
ncbi:hypothetical protein HYS00_01755 [Candidatus Microgenomates bacterium]|nr:hypothetical protein [Candidatus Microgenomates bacterium]